LIRNLKHGQTAFLDQNNLCYGGGAGLDKDLMELCYVQPELIVFGGHLRVYSHPETKYMVIVHKPWCIGLDSRNFVSSDDRIMRMIAAEAVYQFSCAITHGMEYEREKSPLLALYTVLLIHKGFHLPLKAAVRSGVDVLTDDNINAIEESNIPMTHPNNKLYPNSIYNRRIINGRYETKRSSERTDNPNIVNYYAMNICANFAGNINDDNDLVELHLQLVAVFEMDKILTVSDRLRNLRPKLTAVDPKLGKALYSYIESLAANEGNRDHSAATNDEKDVNASHYRAMIQLCHYNGGSATFFARTKAVHVQWSPSAGTTQKKHNNRPAFEVCSSTIINHFAKQQGSSSVTPKTAHFHAEQHKDLYEVTCTKHVDGEWKEMKITNLTTKQAKAAAALAANCNTGPVGTVYASTRKELDQVMFLEMIQLAANRTKKDPAYIWLLGDANDEDPNENAYRPNEFAGCPRFEIRWLKVREYFSPSANKSGLKPIPKGMQVGRATHAGRKLAPKGSGKWCCWKMFME
jgi:hypothetical protein